MTKTVLLVLDGWGVRNGKKGDAISKAQPKHFDKLLQTYPSTTLRASGKWVGLLPGYIGNSEVGHLHLGAGRLVEQDLVQILKEIQSGKILKNKVLVRAMKKAKKSSLHLLGLLSDGGVHSHIKHLFGLLDMAQHFNVERVYVHVITDGRDVPPKSAQKYIKQLERKLRHTDKRWSISSVMGRYYAMDRDNRWNREHKAYATIVQDKGYTATSAQEAVKKAYDRGETDEFIHPTNIIDNGVSHNVKDGDVVLFFNFRSDRARQLTRAFVQGRFKKFKRKKQLNIHFVCLTQYDADIDAPVAYPPEKIKNTLGEVISTNGLRQFRLAETEKYAHVTYFFNGQSGTAFPREERLLIPSPHVTTYDKTPAMSIKKITKKAEQLFAAKDHEFILINFANADMVGHTGDFAKTVEAITIEDACLQRIVEACKKNDYALVITADHGNAEEMIYDDGSICTAHTTNNVPFIIVSTDKVRLRRGTHALYHVAPTILQLMGLKKPREMVRGMLK
ncbi:2,3-bisphosphoglycerate-independent phosphoglycerate mutase [Candidatus Woesearchaeota archaeon]|nr:2,3-bisphosphoglycerate-independent phosphoglycerate mutase [Candidatus Woesearchaeota archaeon]